MNLLKELFLLFPFLSVLSAVLFGGIIPNSPPPISDISTGLSPPGTMAEISKETLPLTLLSPNGGEVWEVGKTYEIRWNGTRYAPTEKIDIVLHDIRYHSEVGDGATVVAEDIPNTGSFLFTVPASFANFSRGKLRGIGVYKISVSLFWGGNYNLINNDKNDESDAGFSIVESPDLSPLSLLYPNGGEKWKIGKTYEIRWDGSHYSPNDKIEIRLIDVARFLPREENVAPLIIAKQALNTGSYQFQVPSTLGLARRKLGGEDIYQLKIALVGQGEQVFDVSGYFSIVPSSEAPIKILSPNGTEEWKAGSTYRVEWVTSKNIKDLRFAPDFSGSDGSDEESGSGVEDEDAREIRELVKRIRKEVSILDAVSSLEQGRYWTDHLFYGNILWEIPSSMSPGKYKLRMSICPASKLDIKCESEIDTHNDGEDESDEYFFILPPDPEVFPNTTPYVEDVSLTPEETGMKITVKGSGFTSTSNTIFRADSLITETNSQDGRTLIFYLPKDSSSLYQLSVKNRNGVSNIIK